MSFKINLPKVFTPFLKPYRFKVAWGGRGSGKSFNIAQLMIIWALMEKKPCVYLCVRETEKATKDSMSADLERAYIDLGVKSLFEKKNKEIHCKNGVKFIFIGLWRDPERVKSIVDIKKCWIEEGQSLSKKSFDALVPTVRMKNSEIIVSMNPRYTTDPLFEMFISNKNPRDDSCVIQVNYYDNPYFKDTELVKEMEYDKKYYYQKYLHVWLGHVSVNEYSIIKEEWFNYYADKNEVIKRITTKIITGDTAFKEKKQNDESVLGVWGFERKERMYLLDMIHGRWDFPTLLEKTKQLWKKHQDDTYGNAVKRMYIEDQASGQSLVPMMRKQRINAYPWKPKYFNYANDKVGRMHTAAIAIQDGRMWLPDHLNHPNDRNFTDHFVTQMAEFSSDMSHLHDDACDMACIATSLLHS